MARCVGGLLVLGLTWGAPSVASAAPPRRGGASASGGGTAGTRGGTSFIPVERDGDGNVDKDSGGGWRPPPVEESEPEEKVDAGKERRFKPPEVVFSGNAISLLMPMQFAFIGYQPRVRIGLQYDRQIRARHWVYVQGAALLDRADHTVFDTNGCGFGVAVVGRCGSGTVAGFDVTAGYTYKFNLKKLPWIVPLVRGGLGFGWWRYADIGGDRQQARERTFAIGLRPGGGVRFFLLKDLGLGLDLNLNFGVMNSREDPIAGISRSVNQFLLGIEILPLVLEHRF